MRNSTCFFPAIVLFFCSCSSNASTEHGKRTDISAKAIQIFKASCSQCHKPDEDMIGPALKGAKSRWKDPNLLYAFVKNPQDVISKDAYAKELFEKWKSYPMQPFPDLTNEEIDAILEYCNDEKK